MLAKTMTPKYAIKWGVIWRKNPLQIKGLSQRMWCTNRLLWHTNSDFYGIRTPPLLCHMNRFYWGWGWSLICWFKGAWHHSKNHVTSGRAPKYRTKGCSRYWRPKFTARKWVKCCKNQCSRSRAVSGWAWTPFCVILWRWLTLSSPKLLKDGYTVRKIRTFSAQRPQTTKQRLWGHCSNRRRASGVTCQQRPRGLLRIQPDFDRIQTLVGVLSLYRLKTHPDFEVILTGF